MVNEFVKHVKLIAIRNNRYTIYVFKELDNDEFIMCTRLPNWQTPKIDLGDKGFLQYQIVEAGDKYITPNGEKIFYQYSNCYFINFVNEIDVVKNNEITL